MAIRITLESFLAVLNRSGLIPEETVAKALEQFKEAGGPTQEARPFAESLLKRKLLTPWQAEKLLQGKHKGFFLGRYRLLDLLGKGGMSSVYLAEHTLMRRRCAIKVLPSKWAKTDMSYLGRFLREAQAVAALDHPNIVRAYDVDHEVDNDLEIHFMVMEYVDGKNLVDIVAEKGKLPVRQAVDYIRQAALGLAHAHRAGLVHRDIKPGNLLVDSQGTVKLLDLGLAKFFSGEDASLTVQHDERVLGTADYLAPEQAVDSHSVDARADIYSLGCSLYFLLTGHPPFDDGTLTQRLIAHQTKEPPPIEQERPDIPQPILMSIRRMMAKDPKDRHASADEVAQELADWLGTGTPAAPPEKQPADSKPASHQRPATSQAATRPAASTSNPMPHSTGRASATHQKNTPSKGSSAAPNTSAVVEPVSGKGVGTLVGDEDLGNFLAQLEASALEPDVRSSSIVQRQGSSNRASETIAESRRSGSSVITSPAAEPQRDGTGVEQPMTREAVSHTSIEPEVERSGSGIRSRNRSRGGRGRSRGLGMIPRILATVGGGVSLLLILWILWANRSAERSGSPSDGGPVVQPGQSTGPKRPTPVVGEDIRIGADGHFATISEAIEFIGSQRSLAGMAVEQTILVPGGVTYAERIRLDNSTRRTIPRGLQIICPDATPAILNPTGPEPVVFLEGAEGIRLENFVIENEDRNVAIQLGGYALGTILRRIRVNGVRGVGIDAQGVSGFAGQRLSLEEMTIQAATSEVVGMRFTSGRINTQDIDIRQCRLLGPMKTGVELDARTWNVSITHCVFDQARSCVTFTGQSPDLRGIDFVNNTFFEFQRGIVFQETPLSGSQGFRFVRNLFARGRGREIDFERGLQPETARQLVAMQRFNWSDRPPASEDTTELDIFSAGGRRGSEVRFVSTSPEDPGYLQPTGRELREAVTESDGEVNYIGAVAP